MRADPLNMYAKGSFFLLLACNDDIHNDYNPDDASLAAFFAKHKTTARGFEPLRAEPNGFLVHHLNHSVTLSLLREARQSANTNLAKAFAS